ncbi:MAG: HAD family hydrolase, partial [Endomicrobiia bacterium]
MKKFFFFDLDGVILNSMPYHAKAMNQACCLFGINISEDIVLNNEGAITYELLEKIAESSNVKLTKEMYFEIISYHKKFFIENYSKEVKPFDGIIDLLYKLKSFGKKLAIVTGSDKEIIDSDLPKEISNVVDVIITSDKIQYRKPHPQPYQKAQEILTAKKEESLAV